MNARMKLAGTSAMALALVLTGMSVSAQEAAVVAVPVTLDATGAAGTYLGRIVIGYDDEGAPIYAGDNRSTLEGRALTAQGGVARLDDVLRQAPSTMTMYNAGQPGVSVAVRGFSGSNVATTVEGVPQNFRFTAHNNADGFTYLDPLLLSSVGITRGADVTKGGMSGAVDFGLLDTTDVVDGEGFGGLARLSYSNNGEGFSALLGAGMIRGNAEASAFVTTRDVAAFENGDGTEIANSEQEAQSYLLRGAYHVNEALSFNLLSSSHETAYSSTQAGFSAGSTIWYDMEVSTQLNKIGGTYDSSDALNLTFGLYHAETEHVHTDGNGSAARGRRMVTETTGFDLENESLFALAGWDVVSTNGLSLVRDDLSGVRGGSNPTEGETNRSALYSQNVLTQGAMEWMLGLRYSSYELSSASPTGDIEVSHDSLDPKISFAYQLNDWLQPYVSVSQSTRAPTSQEVFLGGTHGTSTFDPNPALLPQVSRSFEIGANITRDNLWQSGDQLNARLAFFSQDVEDYIFLGMTEGMFDNLPDSVTNRGIEVEASYESEAYSASLSWTHAQGDYWQTTTSYNPTTHVVTRGQVGGNVQPENVVTATLAAHMLDRALTLGGTYTYNSNGNAFLQFGGASADGRQDYQTLDLFAQYSLSENASVSAKLSNVFDEVYTPWAASVIDSGVGQNLFLGAEFRF